jgi:hypothetical protein
MDVEQGLLVAIKAGHVDAVRMVTGRSSFERVTGQLLNLAVSTGSELMVGTLLLSGKVSHDDAARGTAPSPPPCRS